MLTWSCLRIAPVKIKDSPAPRSHRCSSPHKGGEPPAYGPNQRLLCMLHATTCTSRRIFRHAIPFELLTPFLPRFTGNHKVCLPHIFQRPEQEHNLLCMQFRHGLSWTTLSKMYQNDSKIYSKCLMRVQPHLRPIGVEGLRPDVPPKYQVAQWTFSQTERYADPL